MAHDIGGKRLRKVQKTTEINIKKASLPTSFFKKQRQLKAIPCVIPLFCFNLSLLNGLFYKWY